MNSAPGFFLLLTFVVIVGGWVYTAMLFFGLAVMALIRDVAMPNKRFHIE